MVFWYLAVWWPSAVYDWKEIRNETPNGELLLMMPYDAKEQHFPWSSSALSTLSGACGNPISSSSPHTQTDTQANTSMNTQTITGANTQAQTHKHKNTNNYRYTQIKLDKFILVHYNDQLIMTPVTLICVNANQRRLSGWEGSEREPTVDENSLCLPHLQWQHLLRHCHHRGAEEPAWSRWEGSIKDGEKE